MAFLDHFYRVRHMKIHSIIFIIAAFLMSMSAYASEPILEEEDTIAPYSHQQWFMKGIRIDLTLKFPDIQPFDMAALFDTNGPEVLYIRHGKPSRPQPSLDFYLRSERPFTDSIRFIGPLEDF
jgi:hypothetical protein